MSDNAKACEILRATRDGNLLSPFDLKIVEMAVNHHLNDEGIEYFHALHATVTAGDYQSVYQLPFHGIEHLTIRRSGYVYWRNARVEHYSIPWAFTPEAKAAALRLAAICHAIEFTGATVTGKLVCRYW